MKDFKQALLQKDFKQSNFKEFEIDEIKLLSKGFRFDQVAMFKYNVTSLDKIPPKNRKFYIVKLSKKINDVRFWGSY